MNSQRQSPASLPSDRLDETAATGASGALPPDRAEWVRAAALAALDHRNRGIPRDLRTQLPRNGPPGLRPHGNRRQD